MSAAHLELKSAGCIQSIPKRLQTHLKFRLASALSAVEPQCSDVSGLDVTSWRQHCVVRDFAKVDSLCGLA